MKDTSSVQKAKVYQAIIVALYILPLLAIWQFDYLPMQDYPRHLAGIKVLRDYNNYNYLQESLSVDFFKGISPIPNIAFELFAAHIFFFYDINTVGKIFITSYILLFISSLYLLSRELKMAWPDVLLTALPLAYSTYLYIGFLNFIFSIPLFLLAICSYLCAKREKRYLIVLGITTTLLYISHLFAFVSFLFFLFIDFVMSPRRLKKRFILSVVASMSLPLFFFINYLLFSSGHPTYYHPGGISYKIWMLTFPFIYFSFDWGLLMFFCYICALLLIFYSSSSTNRVFLVAAVSYFIFYAVLPFGGIEGGYIDVRAIAFGMVMLPFSFRLGNMYKRDVFTLIVFLVFINTAVSWSSFSKFQREVSPGIDCFKEVEPCSRLLLVAVEKNGPSGEYYIGEPYKHSWGYAFLTADFITPYFSTSVHHILKYKEKPYNPPDGWYLTNGKGVPWQEVKSHYDYITFFGEDQSINNKISQIGEEICKGGVVTLYRIKK